MRRATLFLAAAMLAACATLGPREADRYFVLEPHAPAGVVPRDLPRSGVDVAPTTSSSFYDTQSIAFSRSAGTRAYYQFNHWTERPQRAIHAALSVRLRVDGPPSALVLDTHLDEMYHDAVVPPGVSRVAVSAELRDAATGAILARQSFARSASAPSYDAEGAVLGFDQAVGSLVDDIAAWVDVQAAKRHP